MVTKMKALTKTEKEKDVLIHPLAVIPVGQLSRIEKTFLQQGYYGLTKFVLIKYFIAQQMIVELQFRSVADARLQSGMMRGSKVTEADIHKRTELEKQRVADILSNKPEGRRLPFNTMWLAVALIVLAGVAFFQSNPTALHSVQQYFQVYGLHIIVASTLIVVSALYFLSRRRKRANR